MTEHDLENFTLLMAGIAELYSKKLSKLLLNIYWKSLKKYSLTEINEALEFHMMDKEGGHFMPKPNEIALIIDGNVNDQSLEAWTKVLNAIRHVGSYDSVVFDDPLIHVCIMDVGGWIYLCRQDNAALTWTGKQFERLYKNYLKKPLVFYPRQLLGQFSHVSHEHEIQTLRLLGDPNRANQVYRKGFEAKDYLKLSSNISTQSNLLPNLSQEQKVMSVALKENKDETYR